MFARLAGLGTLVLAVFMVAARAPQEPGDAALASVSDHSGCCNVTVGAAVYKSACVVCHGKEGKGDGPVAVAMKPRPANLADTTRMPKLSDDSLFQVITSGRRGMPSFAADLKPEQVRELVNYIRNLKP